MDGGKPKVNRYRGKATYLKVIAIPEHHGSTKSQAWLRAVPSDEIFYCGP